MSGTRTVDKQIFIVKLQKGMEKEGCVVFLHTLCKATSDAQE